MTGHHAILLGDQEEARRMLQTIGSSTAGCHYMIPKAIFRCIKLKDIPARSANLIKQEMLAKGGEAAVARHTINGEANTDVLLMGTLRQYQLLNEKLRAQPFGMAGLAGEIESILEGLESSEYNVRLANGEFMKLGQRTLIMGILNVTPDSFSDGGCYLDPDAAVRRAMQMREEGADIIDLGGVSTRPGAGLAGEEEELARVLPVVERLSREKLIISVDTYRARVASEVLDRGASLINNIGAWELDPGLLPVLAERQAAVIVMHNRMQLALEQPYSDLIGDITAELKGIIKEASAAGLKEQQIIIDPGLGFGKTTGENRLLLKRLQSFRSLGRPILIGASRKSFIGNTLDLEVGERLEGSLAALAVGIMNGADIVRVHDVRASKRMARMIDAIMRENG